MKRIIIALAALAVGAGAVGAALIVSYCPVTVTAGSITFTDSPRKFRVQETTNCGATTTDGCCFSEDVTISKWDPVLQIWATVSSTSMEVHGSCNVTGGINVQDYPIAAAGMYKCQLIVTDCVTGAVKFGPKVVTHTFP